jgi:quercetin dioxygenase-like cupin family protein
MTSCHFCFKIASSSAADFCSSHSSKFRFKQQNIVVAVKSILIKGRMVFNMIEKQFQFQQVNSKIIERIIDDDNVNINHMVLPKGNALPEHFSNSNVYMIVSRGNITLRLDEQQEHIYPSGSIIAIPYNTKMNISNRNDEILEFFVVKAPSPRFFNK